MDTPAVQNSPDAGVAARQAQNPHCAQLMAFMFVEHQTFELMPELVEYLEQHFAKVDLGPVALAPGELSPPPIPGLDLGKAHHVDAYWQQYAVTSRFLYAFVRDPKASPSFMAELWIDKNGLISVLTRKAFDDIGKAGDDEDDQVYLERFAKTHEKTWRFPSQSTPSDAVDWHFYASSVRLDRDTVTALEKSSLFDLDPGHRSLYRCGKAALVRVLEPTRVVEQMTREYEAALQQWRRFELPQAEGAKAELIERRRTLTELALHIERYRRHTASLSDELSSTTNELWEALADECLGDERRFIRDPPVGDPLSAALLLMLGRVRGALHNAVLRHQAKLIRFLISDLWQLCERAHYRQAHRGDKGPYHLLEKVQPALVTLGQADLGAAYLAALTWHVAEDNMAPVPNAETLQTFAMFDVKLPSWVDLSKTTKRFTVPLVELIKVIAAVQTRFSFGRADAFYAKYATQVPKELAPMVDALPKRQRVLVTVAAVTTGRLNSVTAEPGGNPPFALFFEPAKRDDIEKATRVFADRAEGKKPTPSLSVAIRVVEDNVKKGRVALYIDDIKPRVKSLSLGFALVAAGNAVIEGSLLEKGKGGLGVVKAIYELPWMDSWLEKSFETAREPKMGSFAGKVMMRRLGFALQAGTLAFSVADAVTKQGKAGTTSEEKITAWLEASADAVAVMAIFASPTGAPALLLGLLSFALGAAAFAFDRLKPTDAAVAFRHCRFGKEYPVAPAGEDLRAKPWMACRDQDLRHFHPKHKVGGKALGNTAYHNQTQAFFNLLVNFTLACDVDGVRAGVDIAFGSLPRVAYFDVYVTLVAESQKGQKFELGFSLRYDPYPLNLPPGPPGETGELVQYRSQGITGIGGGPCFVEVIGGIASTRLVIRPRAGSRLSWKSTIEDNTPRQRARRARAKVHYRVRALKEKNQFAVDVRPSSDTNGDLELLDIDIIAVVARVIPDTSGVFDRKPLKLEHVKPQVVKQDGSFTLNLALPDQHVVEKLRLRVHYRDRFAPSRELVTSESKAPDVTPGDDEDTLDDEFRHPTDDKVQLRIKYSAELRHTGANASVAWTIDGVDLRVGSSAWHETGGIEVDQARLHFARGDDPKGFAWLLKAPEGFDGVWRIDRSMSGPDPIMHGEFVRRRVSVVTGGVVITEPWLEEVEVPWGYPQQSSLDLDALSKQPFEVKAAKAYARMVTGYDLGMSPFMPHDLTQKDQLAWVAAEFSKPLLPGFPPPKPVAAIDACKARKE